VKEAVVAGALVVAAFNLLPALLGGWLWYWGEPTERSARGFWFAVRVGQGAVLALAIAVASLAVAGKRSSEGLFYLYALLPIAVGFIAEQLRIASAQTVLDQRGLEDSAAVGALDDLEQRGIVEAIVRREVGVMSLAAVVVCVLALRAAGTAHGF
jgi:hypothetical protein